MHSTSVTFDVCSIRNCISHNFFILISSLADNEQFLANTNCPVVLLLQYMRAKMGLPETELVDLCDDRGALKLLFLSQQPQECASRLLPPRCSLIFCIVNRNPKDGAYISITPLVANPDPALLETLQTQTDSLERARLRQLRSQEDRRATEAPSQTQPTQTVSMCAVCVCACVNSTNYLDK
uniref:Chromosome X open reading frame 65 n=1 Tax=Hucho hucho TaxID=62062 RepID=A0A4W5NFH5_9TELE